MTSQLRQSAWWIWLLPAMIFAALPLLVIGLLTQASTNQMRFLLWGVSAAVLVLAVAVWAASHGLSYSLWLGLTAGVVGIALLIFRELIAPLVTDPTSAYRLPAFIRARPGYMLHLFREAGVGAMVVCVLFLIGEFITRRRAKTGNP
jgi:cation transport ATPase